MLAVISLLAAADAPKEVAEAPVALDRRAVTCGARGLNLSCLGRGCNFGGGAVVPAENVGDRSLVFFMGRWVGVHVWLPRTRADVVALPDDESS